jgi:hypothetical protein
MGMAMKKMPASIHQMLQPGVGGVVGVIHTGTVKVLSGVGGQVGLKDGPLALTATLYAPGAVRSSGPVAPLPPFVQTPSAIPSVVLGAIVVFVKKVPPGVVTSQSNEVARGGEIFVVRATAAVPDTLPDTGAHPVTTAPGVSIVGHMHVWVTGAESDWSGHCGDLKITVVIPVWVEPGA